MNPRLLPTRQALTLYDDNGNDRTTPRGQKGKVPQATRAAELGETQEYPECYLCPQHGSLAV